jgi:DeoR/GlpR family transcriptional regulator of sugar metabolism
VIAVGGTLRRLNRSFVGPVAVDDVRRHFADLAFFSIKAVGASGTLIEADPLEAEVKRAMIAQAAEPVVLLDGSKLSARGLTAVVEIGDVARVLAAGVGAEDAARLRAHGARVEVVEPGDVEDSASR